MWICVSHACQFSLSQLVIFKFLQYSSQVTQHYKGFILCLVMFTCLPLSISYMDKRICSPEHRDWCHSNTRALQYFRFTNTNFHLWLTYWLLSRFNLLISKMTANTKKFKMLITVPHGLWWHLVCFCVSLTNSQFISLKEGNQDILTFEKLEPIIIFLTQIIDFQNSFWLF